MLSTIKRTSQKQEMICVCEDTAKEAGYELVEIIPPMGYTYQAVFKSENFEGEFTGLILKNNCPECDADEMPSIVVAFSHGQMVSCRNGHVHHIERDEWFYEIGAGDE